MNSIYLNTAYIGLGSNLNIPVQQVDLAIEAISNIVGVQLVKSSSLYISRPMGPQDQDDYINAVVAIRTQLAAIDLLNALQRIENDAGRVRKENRWGARVLDCDILLFADQTIDTPRLTVPHYGLASREFVLLPLAEISPELLLPDGRQVALLANSIEKNGIEVYTRKQSAKE